MSFFVAIAGGRSFPDEGREVVGQRKVCVLNVRFLRGVGSGGRIGCRCFVFLPICFRPLRMEMPGPGGDFSSCRYRARRARGG